MSAFPASPALGSPVAAARSAFGSAGPAPVAEAGAPGTAVLPLRERASSRLPGLLIQGAAEIVTMAGGLRMGAAQDDPALVADPAPLVASWEDRIVAVGGTEQVLAELQARGLPLDGFERLDAAGGTVTPGLVDPHTHLLFAGTREAELRLRQRGATYLEILAAGGGILSTVAATRAATDQQLLAAARHWLREMLHHGSTTVEVKSGYGLSVESELRLLDIARRVDLACAVDVVPTFLGAHAVPAEFRGRPDPTDAYVDDVVERQLPAVAAQGVARFCDVFCEAGVFSAAQSRRILEAGLRLGLGARLHADELAPSGGAELAAELGAVSADHLAAPSPEGIDALARAAASGRPVVATLLPATSWFLMADHAAPARTLIERGVPVALATDFNPGTSPAPNLHLALAVGCLELKLTPAEALAAATVNAAHALGLGGEIGSLAPGRLADVVIWRVPTHAQIPYWLGADLVRTVVKRGRVVVGD